MYDTENTHKRQSTFEETALGALAVTVADITFIENLFAAVTRGVTILVQMGELYKFYDLYWSFFISENLKANRFFVKANRF